jgi:hypothetical protein
MHTRLLHAAIACGLFLLGATVFGNLSGQQLDLMCTVLWSVAGIGSYVSLSYLFGFDPHRTRVAAYASALTQYVDRWELRLGQATLSMLGLVVVAAGLFDAGHFVTAVVSGTMSAWTYFAFRFYVGGYRTPARSRR